MSQKPNEKPILFSSEMVKKILSGEKTQTRRVIKPQPRSDMHWRDYYHGSPFKDHQTDSGVPDLPCWRFWDETGLMMKIFKSPYGKVGGLLWVRETFLDEKDYPCSPYHEDENLSRLLYRADIPEEQAKACVWKPSIYMPRWASRITLEIINLKAERLQDISVMDMKAEGINPIDQRPKTYRYYFEKLWDEINGKREGCSWEANPFVWVIEFKNISAQKDAA